MEDLQTTEDEAGMRQNEVRHDETTTRRVDTKRRQYDTKTRQDETMEDGVRHEETADHERRRDMWKERHVVSNKLIHLKCESFV